MSQATQFSEMYDNLFVKLADPRVESWLFMKDPSTPLVLLAVYLYAIYYKLPQYMKDRKPYDLKNIIQLYNIVQVILCSYVTYGIATSGWTTDFSLGCQPVDYSDDKQAVRLLTMVYFTFLMKILDLIETCFFILRHKNDQVSKLHVYHHCSTLLMMWIICKYIGGGMTTFSLMLNNGIHVIMYTYYYISALQPNIRRKIAFLKPKLTILQMIQFCIIITHGAQALKSDCLIPDLGVYIFVPNVIVIFGFFINFYVKRYTTDKKKSKFSK